jgi:hypothetical protein
MNLVPQRSGSVHLIVGLSIGLGVCTSAPAQIVLDFQKQHTLEQVKKSGVKLRSFPGDPNFYALEESDLVLKLPGGQEVHAKAKHASLTTNSSGLLQSLQIHGPILPTDEAYLVAQKVHQAFHIPTDRLEQWRTDIIGKGRDALNFTNANNDYYPDVFFEMGFSMNTLYPWYMRIEIGWNALPGDNRDESWGAANNPKPPTGLERLSLDSPTGKTYDRKEAYAHLKKAQEELDRRLGQVRDTNGHLVNPQPPTPKIIEVKPTQPAPSGEPTSSTPWSIIGVLIAAATGLLWLLVKSRK